MSPLIFRNILAEHNRVEQIVKSSALTWTIARPSALTNRPPTGYVATLKLQPRTYLTARADLAAFIADELETDQYVRQPVFITSRGEKQKGAMGGAWPAINNPSGVPTFFDPLWSKKSCVGLKSSVTVMVSGFQACS